MKKFDVYGFEVVMPNPNEIWVSGVINPEQAARIALYMINEGFVDEKVKIRYRRQRSFGFSFKSLFYEIFLSRHIHR